MTDRTQFEAMLEALINEDQETAKEIFHNIVVAKSREIYEELLKEDFNLAEGEEEEEEEEESMEEGSDEEGADDSDSDSEDDEVGGDATDDFIDDTEDDAEGEEDPFGGEEGEGEGELEDRVLDLEDALDELKAEFEQLMADEEDEGHHDDMDMGAEPADMGGDDLGFDEDDAMAVDPAMMEYVNKVGLPKHGDNGANTKSIVASKNDMGGTTANIARGGEAKGEGTKGGLLKPTTQLQDGGNINKPGANAGKTAFKKKEPGHGAEKKGSGEHADNKKSIVGSR